jgi:hypothetical protein
MGITPYNLGGRLKMGLSFMAISLISTDYTIPVDTLETFFFTDKNIKPTIVYNGRLSVVVGHEPPVISISLGYALL